MIYDKLKLFITNSEIFPKKLNKFFYSPEIFLRLLYIYKSYRKDFHFQKSTMNLSPLFFHDKKIDKIFAKLEISSHFFSFPRLKL